MDNNWSENVLQKTFIIAIWSSVNEAVNQKLRYWKMSSFTLQRRSLPVQKLTNLLKDRHLII
jgi:hypothetical protein